MPQTNSIISNPSESQSALMEEHINALAVFVATQSTATLNQSAIEHVLTQPDTDTLANGFFNLLVDNANAREIVKSICTNDETFFQLADRLLITVFTRYGNLTLTIPPLWRPQQEQLHQQITNIVASVPAARYRTWIESLSNRLPLGLEFVLFESVVAALCQQGQPIGLLDDVFVNKRLEEHLTRDNRQ
ncbi:MAG: hypothetical protein ACK4PR_08970, partial [Gammaproteobacteria bacterium]